MLRLALGRQARGVGGQEGERCVRVLAVFRQVEMHAADQVPGRVARFEEGLERQLGRCQFLVQGGIQLVPQCGQQLGRKVFCACYGRRIGDQDFEIFGGRCGDCDLTAVWRGAQGRDIARRHITPPGPGRRQNLADLSRSQLQQAMPAAQRKNRAQCLADLRCQRRCVVLRRGQQVAAGCQLRRKRFERVQCLHCSVG